MKEHVMETNPTGKSAFRAYISDAFKTLTGKLKSTGEGGKPHNVSRQGPPISDGTAEVVKKQSVPVNPAQGPAKANLSSHITGSNIESKKTLNIFGLKISLPPFMHSKDRKSGEGGEAQTKEAKPPELSKAGKQFISDMIKANGNEESEKKALEKFFSRPINREAEFEKMFNDPKVDHSVKGKIQQLIINNVGGDYQGKIECRVLINNFKNANYDFEKGDILKKFCGEKPTRRIIDAIHEELKISTLKPEEKSKLAREFAEMLSEIGKHHVEIGSRQVKTTSDYWKSKLDKPDAGYSWHVTEEDRLMEKQKAQIEESQMREDEIHREIINQKASAAIDSIIAGFMPKQELIELRSAMIEARYKADSKNIFNLLMDAVDKAVKEKKADRKTLINTLIEVIDDKGRIFFSADSYYNEIQQGNRGLREFAKELKDYLRQELKSS